jgi:predicted peptidase
MRGIPMWVMGLAVAGLPAVPPAAAAGAAAGRPAGFVPLDLRLGGAAVRCAVYVPAGYDSARAWPCVVFLHGSGECGDDGEKPTRIGLGPALLAHPERWPCLVVFPQKPREDEEWEEHEDLVFAALDAVARRYRVDADRVALTGISQGGHGTWMIGARHAGRWSCLAPVCGYGRAQTVARRVARLPVWAFHGLKDDIVDPEDTRQIVAAIRAERQRLGLDPDAARMTLYPEANHGSWDPAYAEEELPRWLLAQRRPASPVQ